MNLSKHTVSLVVLLLSVLASTSIANAQSDPASQLEPSYEVALHLVIGSNAPGPGIELPSSLSNISKQLKGNFQFPNYRLANTLIGRISNTGSFEYKSVTNILGQETDAESQSFLEWSLANFRATSSGYQARSFRFGAKIPIRMGVTKDGSGGVSPIVTYESVGLTMNTIGLPANTPTLIGTISLPRTTGTIFIVATVRPASI